ncbi:MAG: hypothetical protein KGS48_18445 [Bacteroidetes bacterium]|nr:hypothetical protein [Bacteroidota bacterium]
MNKFTVITDALLWDYVDGFLDEADDAHVKIVLEQSPELRQKLALIVAEKSAWACSPLESTPPAFADSVMAAWAGAQWNARATQTAQDPVMRLIPIALGALLLLCLILIPFGAFNADPLLYIPNPEWALIWVQKLAQSPVLYFAVLLLVVFLTLRIFDQMLRSSRLVYGKR